MRTPSQPRSVPALLVLAALVGGGEAAAQNPTLGGVPPGHDTRLRHIALTWVEVGFFNEVDQQGFKERTLHIPDVLRFRWGTSGSGADSGLWRLRVEEIARYGAEPTFTQLATGNAGPPGATFAIDLRPHLPAQPPAQPRRYHVEVVARKAASVAPTGASPGRSGTKVPAREIGSWSPPVVITYVQSDTPITSFDFPEVYREVTLVLDEVVLVDDQYGPGREEYYISGFVQELFRECSDAPGGGCRFSIPGKQVRFGPDVDADLDCDNQRPYFRCLNPPAASDFGIFHTHYHEPHRWTFRLSSQPGTWPRRYAVALSLLEEDAGGSVAAWDAGLRELGEAVEVGEILKMSESAIEQYLSEHAADAIRFVADGVRTAALAAGANAGAVTVVGAAVAVVAYVVVAIIEDMEDDYYGTRMGTLELSSNRVDEIHALDGTQRGDTFVLAPQSLRFQGPPPSGSASAFDGVVDIVYHWEFSERVLE